MRNKEKKIQTRFYLFHGFCQFSEHVTIDLSQLVSRHSVFGWLKITQTTWKPSINHNQC